MGFWGGTIFLMHTHKHTSDGDYELSKNPPVCSEQLLFTVQQYGSK